MDPNRRIRALIIEDDTDMADLVRNLLRKRFNIEGDIAPDCASARSMMTSTDYDIMTLDYRLPDGAGLDLLDEITESFEHPPVIMVTGHGDEETAARSFRSRASGYVVKDSKMPEVLTEAVEKALAEIALKRIERELLDEKAFIEDALNSLPDMFAVLDIEGNMFRWNSRVSEVTGYGDSELASMNIIDLCAPEDAGRLADGLREMKDSGGAIGEVTLTTRTGEKLGYELSGQVLRNPKGVPIGFCGLGRDVTELKSRAGENKMPANDLERLLAERTTELETAREELKKSEQQSRAVFDNSLDLIGTFDENGVFLSCNRASESILGYTPDEFIGMTVFDFVHPDDLGTLLDSHEFVLGDTGSTRKLELRFKHRSGDWTVLECVGQGYSDADGGLRVVVNARDITDRRKAEEELREREQQLRMITNNMQDVIIKTDLAGISTYISPSFETLLGYDPEEWLGRSVQELVEFVHPEERQEVMEAFLRGLETFVPSRQTFRAKHADGHHIWVEALGTPLLDDDDNVVGGVVTCRDITEPKMAEEEVRESEERYRSVFDLSPDYIYLVGGHGVILDANKALLDRYGLTLEELSSTSYLAFFKGENFEEVKDSVKKLRAGEPVRGLEVKVKSPKGEDILLEVNSVPLLEDGEVKYALSLARDITERKRIEEELRKLNSELEGYARTVSHDLRAPLTSIKLAGENLARTWEKRDSVEDIDADIARIAEIIGLSTSQAEDLINDLLTLAMAAEEPEEVSVVDVTATVNRVLEERASLIKEKGVVVSVARDLGSLHANPVHVYQLFSNFIDNAIKHNDKPHPEIRISYLGDGPGGHVYVVEDNGPGIPPADQVNIFLPFYKGQNGYTGIGLAIVDKIVKLYDGSVKVHGDGGARFEFSLKDR